MKQNLIQHLKKILPLFKINDMIILELKNRVEVITPVGKGFIWLVTEYGTETSKVFTVIQDSGEIWEWQPKNTKVLNNITFNRLNK